MNYDPVERIKRKLTDRMLRAGDHAVRHLKAVVGVQAPLVPGSFPPRAATRATPSAPPRRVTGRGQAGVYFLFHLDENEAKLSFGDDMWYMMLHEIRNPPMDHKWLVKTLKDRFPDLIRILKGGTAGGLSV